MRARIKALSRRLSRLPVVGRFVHITAAVYHLPRLRAQIESGLSRVAALEDAWHRRHSSLLDANTRISQRILAVEQSAIGLLTEIMGQLGALKADLNLLADKSTTTLERVDALDRSNDERLTQSAAESEAFRTKLGEVIDTMTELRLDIGSSHSASAQQMAEVRTQVSDLQLDVTQIYALKAVADQFAATLRELQLATVAGEESARSNTVGAADAAAQAAVALQRVDALTASLGNVIRSMPIVLRELRREQTRLQRLLTSPTDDGNAALQPTPPSQALDALIENGDSYATQATDAIRKELEALSQQVERSTGAQQESLERVQQFTDTLNFLVGRIEFVRREVLFEMRYGKGVLESPDQQLKVTSRIIAVDKIATAREHGLRLNLGCGHVPLPGYINVDRRELPGVDVVAEVEDLPFEHGEVAEIRSAHVLEHFPQEQLLRELLPYWRDLLREGGQFKAVVPDAQAMIEHYARGEYGYDDMREVIYGAQDYMGDFHYNMFTPDSLGKMLADSGFMQVHVDESGRKNGKCYEFDIRATKGS